MAHHQAASTPLPDQPVNKWEALRALSVARQNFNLSDRALGVLQALLSFHPGTDLGEDPNTLVVFPSNTSICERLNGMPCSTMRRHLAALVAAGVILRHDSPNGKRFARHSAVGRHAFGFDLSPLLRRFAEFTALEEDIRQAAEAHKRLRQTVSLMRRDLAGLAEYGARHGSLPLWDRLSDLAALSGRDLRRKLSMAELTSLKATLEKALDEARNSLELDESSVLTSEPTTILSTSPSQNEHHHQRSDKDSNDSEKSQRTKEKTSSVGASNYKPRHLPLPMVLEACPTLQSYLPEPIRHWHQFANAVTTIRPMMNISPSAWDDAVRIMGLEEAATAVAALLERFSDLRSPGGYLRALTAKAAAGTFTTNSMIIALLKKQEPHAALAEA